MNTFSRIHPGVTSVYFLTILLFSMFVMNPVLELLTLLGGLLYCWSLTGWGNRLRDLGFYLLMVLLMALMNPLFSHNGKTPLFFMNGNAVTVEAIAYGGAMGVMVVGILLWCRSYSILMTSDKFVYLVGSAMPKLAVVLSSALRYVPMLKRQARKVHRTQRAMGLYTSDSYADRVRASLRVLSVLVSWSLENAVETSHSMAARGYGLAGRTNYSNFTVSGWDISLLVAILALSGGTVAGLMAGALDFTWYPAVGGATLTPLGLFSYGCFGVLALLPVLLEWEERIRWNYSRSKI
ncbi:MAG: energy-coupling factor transporter transmembrane component T [Oscillospiraceae bacterium]|nr:energy-coupling factor transporter transmembrane protein EcfT [Bacillota bacterium]